MIIIMVIRGVFVVVGTPKNIIIEIFMIDIIIIIRKLSVIFLYSLYLSGNVKPSAHMVVIIMMNNSSMNFSQSAS